MHEHQTPECIESSLCLCLRLPLSRFVSGQPIHWPALIGCRQSASHRIPVHKKQLLYSRSFALPLLTVVRLPTVSVAWVTVYHNHKNCHCTLQVLHGLPCL